MRGEPLVSHAAPRTMVVAPAELAVADLSMRRGARVVLDHVTFGAERGELLAVLGPNGCGKTTLLETLVGVLPRSGGRVRVAGRELSSFRDHASVFAYMPDEAALPEEVRIETLLGRPPSDLEEALGVTPLRGARGGELSRGEAKRVWLALALAQDRPIAVLDEPFGAFDPLQLDGILEVVRGCAVRGQTIIVTIHQMSTAERIADRVVMLAKGTVVAAGPLGELATRFGAGSASADDVFRAVLGGQALRAEESSASA